MATVKTLMPVSTEEVVEVMTAVVVVSGICLGTLIFTSWLSRLKLTPEDFATRRLGPMKFTSSRSCSSP